MRFLVQISRVRRGAVQPVRATAAGRCGTLRRMSIRINRVYTRSGDKGDTGLVGGRRVGKDALRIECYGTVDELNATIGMARLHTAVEALRPLDAILARVQNELFNL